MRWLLDNLPVDERCCLIHATHLDEGEIADLAASRAVAGLCPTTEANLGDGIFAARDYLAAGGRYGVGSDSNIRLSVAEELRMLEVSQRLDAWIFGVEGSAVSEVWSAGRHIVRGGEHVRAGDIRARFAATMRELGAAL